MKKITCTEAIEEAVKKIGMATADQIHNYLKEYYAGRWTEDSISQGIMCAIVNLEPAHQHWKNARTFLFLHEDGRFELENSRMKTIEFESPITKEIKLESRIKPNK